MSTYHIIAYSFNQAALVDRMCVVFFNSYTKVFYALRHSERKLDTSFKTTSKVLLFLRFSSFLDYNLK